MLGIANNNLCSHLKLAWYHQHLHELLEMDLSPLDYMMKKFPEFKERDEMRRVCTISLVFLATLAEG